MDPTSTWILCMPGCNCLLDLILAAVKSTGAPQLADTTWTFFRLMVDLMPDLEGVKDDVAIATCQP